MPKPILKNRILLGNKLLGDLFYFKDKNGRSSLKFSFKNKITDFTRWTNVKTILPVPVFEKEPLSFDLSYKFQDNLLEIKRQRGTIVEREFYKKAYPQIDIYLFLR